MLDLDNPRSNHVFAAARQEDLILGCCKSMTLADTPACRTAFLDILRPAFAALRWLNRERFGDSAAVAASLDQWEREVEALAGLPLQDPPPAGRCPACGGRPTRPGKYDPQAYCPACLGLVLPGRDLVESSPAGFGTVWI